MINISDVVKVGIADMNIVQAPQLIRTSGLGSCVGIVIYDQLQEIAGMVHIMLPDSSLARNGQLNEAKYADTGIKKIIEDLLKQGARRYSLKAKIAGGAQMFTFASTSDIMRIGPRNVEAVKKELAKNRIPIIGEDVGGSSGRTIEFDPKSAILNIRTVNKGVTQL